MSSLTVSAKGNSTFEVHPAMPVAARCTRIIDLGTQAGEYKGESKLMHKVLVQWESEQLMPETSGEHAGKPYLISQRCTASLSEKAKLRSDLESWRGRKFSAAELEGFDLKSILGKPCMINVVHGGENGKVYANIGSIMPLPASMTAPQAVGDLVFFSFENFSQTIFGKLSEGVQKTIQASLEWKEMHEPRKPTKAAEEAGPVADMAEDDIPF